MIAKFKVKENKFEVSGTEMNLFGNDVVVEINEKFEYVNLWLGQAYYNLSFDEYEEFKQEMTWYVEDNEEENIWETENQIKAYFNYL